MPPPTHTHTHTYTLKIPTYEVIISMNTNIYAHKTMYVFAVYHVIDELFCNNAHNINTKIFLLSFSVFYVQVHVCMGINVYL